MDVANQVRRRHAGSGWPLAEINALFAAATRERKR
jgi:hypothetical protein